MSFTGYYTTIDILVETISLFGNFNTCLSSWSRWSLQQQSLQQLDSAFPGFILALAKIFYYNHIHTICCYFYSRNQANMFRIEWILTREYKSATEFEFCRPCIVQQSRIECRTANLLFKFMKILLEVPNITGNQSVNFCFCISSNTLIFKFLCCKERSNTVLHTSLDILISVKQGREYMPSL